MRQLHANVLLHPQKPCVSIVLTLTFVCICRSVHHLFYKLVNKEYRTDTYEARESRVAAATAYE